MPSTTARATPATRQGTRQAQKGQNNVRDSGKSAAAPAATSPGSKSAQQPDDQLTDSQQPEASTSSDSLRDDMAVWFDTQRLATVSQMFQNQQQEFNDRFLDQVLRKVRQEFAPVLEKVDVLQGEVESLKGKVADLEQRLEISQPSMSAVPEPQGSLSQAAPSGQFEKLVYGLATDKMQEQDDADKGERIKKEKNAILRRFEQADNETPETLKQQVDTLLSDTMGTSVACISAQRVKGRTSGTAPPLVVVQFETKHDKITVFKARRKLADSRVGIDDDLTRLQQERRMLPGQSSRSARQQASKPSGGQRSSSSKMESVLLSTKCPARTATLWCCGSEQ